VPEAPSLVIIVTLSSLHFYKDAKTFTQQVQSCVSGLCTDQP